MKQQFEKFVKQNIESLSHDRELHALTREWLCASGKHNYVYNFSYLGRPIIQLPQDIVAMQELFWEVKPDLVIETGIAHGGSIIFSASMLALLEKCNFIENGLVVAIDIDIREHNRVEIEKHPLCSYIKLLEGSSVADTIVDEVTAIAGNHKRIMVCLDSNHTHDHVLQELRAYAPLVSMGSYCVVFDTCIEDTPDEFYSDRPWCKGNNPKTAVWEYLKTNDDFEIDKSIENKLLITSAPDGFLRKVK
jgi:cephalosporin hydroxylase